MLKEHNQERTSNKAAIKLPKMHQEDALKKLWHAAQEYSRYSCIMACGTGKTLVALWHAEQLQARNILVLLPSLGLLNQTLHEWLANTQLPSLKYLCVCSDQSIGNDDDTLHYHPEDLDFLVTTQSSEVTQYLKNCDKNDTVIIFSTYHSAQVVGDAAGKNFQFDLIIFDEAHKTAGEADKAFSYALYDKNIKGAKRLFMTATPRVLNQTKMENTNDINNSKTYISMCDEALYGPTAYSLNFKQSVDLGIIVDYKIIISVVTSEMVNKVLRKAQIKFKNKKIDALAVAHMLAIQHAAQEHSIHKLISFHSRVKQAAAFQTMVDEHWFELLSSFNAQHVSGAMQSSKRKKNINLFKNSQNGILTNARCLTEGIDVPTVDMVAFLCNKRSRVDIVQAAGRVMRKAPKKQLGYILIPFYIKDDTKDIEKTLQNLRHSDYTDIWYILNMLSDHDNILHDIINGAKSYSGEYGKTNSSILKEKIIVTSSEEISIKLLRENILTLSLANIGNNWHYYYGRLKKFKTKYGHCNVPQDYSNKSLANWVVSQRKRHQKGDINLELKNKLDQIDFIWNVNEVLWQKYYEELKKFISDYGHSTIPTTDNKYEKLFKWLSRQRKLYHRNKLSDERIILLNKLKISWEPTEDSWLKKYKELEEYTRKNGSSFISRNQQEYIKLYQWCHQQRENHKKNILGKKKTDLLNMLNFSWNPIKDRWQSSYNELAEHYKKNKSFDKINNKKLLTWVRTQRAMYKKSKLTTERIKLLKSINFEFNPK